MIQTKFTWWFAIWQTKKKQEKPFFFHPVQLEKKHQSHVKLLNHQWDYCNNKKWNRQLRQNFAQQQLKNLKETTARGVVKLSCSKENRKNRWGKTFQVYFEKLFDVLVWVYFFIVVVCPKISVDTPVMLYMHMNYLVVDALW